MTNQTDQERAQAFVEQMRDRLARPMPLQAQRELALCTSVDTLGASLALTRAALEAARAAVFNAGATPATPAMTIVAWATSLQALGDAIEQADRDGMATILAVRTLL